MSSSEPAPQSTGKWQKFVRPAQVIIVGSVMFTFISAWRTAAVVLCDLASTAYYIGGIVEQSIGPAAPWFILAVMLFSYCVRWVYIESCTLFVRGGVYRVVRAALGGLFAKIAVSALIFDYLLTGPISGVSAGQYLMGLFMDTFRITSPGLFVSLGLTDLVFQDHIRDAGAVIVAILVTLYFYRQNLLGIHESSEKALKIMIATTIMAVIMISWCGITIWLRGPNSLNTVPLAPDLSAKYQPLEVQHIDPATGESVLDPITGEPEKRWKRNPAHETDPSKPAFEPALDEKGQPVPRINRVTQKQEDPIGFLAHILPESWSASLRHPASWLSLIGLFGIFIAFGHSILAMSGEETLAQVYREVESPKLRNFKKAAFIVFIYSICLTGGISFLAVLLIPDDVRMMSYSDNLISGLALNVVGPFWARLLLSAFVVIIGAFILSGAVNTAIIGSNGVLNRVAEDGVLPDWFRKPHPRYGTTHRILYLIVGLQIVIILISRGDTLLLGEAYAFGVVWSFVFQALSMVVLRFKDPRPRAFKVPLNLRLGGVEVPFGLLLILFVLLGAALTNFLTKEVATVSGLTFTLGFFLTFTITEAVHKRQRQGEKHEHVEQFNQETAPELTGSALALTHTFRKLVAIRSPHNLFMLEKALAETDPLTTDLIIMTAKVQRGEGEADPHIDAYDQGLMTAVVDLAEKAGKQVHPLIVPTNQPLHAILRTAQQLEAQEVIVGASNIYTAEEQLDQIGFYWINLHGGDPKPLTVRILARDRDVSLDLAGGSRIPTIEERKARSVAELRAAGVGVDRVLFLHDNTPATSDLFEAVLTMLDARVALGVVPLPGNAAPNGHWSRDLERCHQLERDVEVLAVAPDRPLAGEILRLVREGKFDVLILPMPTESPGSAGDFQGILRQAPCPVLLASPPTIPREVMDHSGEIPTTKDKPA